MRVKQKDWKNAAISASNLSELELTLGEVAGAVGDAEQSVTYADRSGDAFQRMVAHAPTVANALHQAGRRAEAETRFREAEQMQAKRQPDYPLLYSLRGFLVLRPAPRRPRARRVATDSFISTLNPQLSTLTESCRAVSQRAAQTLKWAEMDRGWLAPQTSPSTTSRWAAPRSTRRFCETFRPPTSEPLNAFPTLDAAVDRPPPRRPQRLPSPRPPHPRLAASFSHRRAHRPRERAGGFGRSLGNRRARPHETLPGRHPPLPRPALWKVGTRKSECANEAGQYPWESPPADLAAAEKLINDCGYHRRDEELADAKAAILSR